jgi:hypothetical protein
LGTIASSILKIVVLQNASEGTVSRLLLQVHCGESKHGEKRIGAPPPGVLADSIRQVVGRVLAFTRQDIPQGLSFQLEMTRIAREDAGGTD